VAGSRLTLPNVITVVRIAVCPLIFALALAPTPGGRLWAFVLFIAAGVSDVWDGWLARRHGWITDLGKLLDPLADKLLLAATLIPFYIQSHRGPEWHLPWWGPLPLWVVLVIFGRELFITIFRSYAAARGVIIAAGASGKRKAVYQSLFIGGLLFWYPLSMIVRDRGWDAEVAWRVWSAFHGMWIAATLVAALVLTVYSMLDYLWRYRSVVGVRG
jgi:CDP-diacylglycerol--glycerol-3-phosphate 3-phosphatidyltransferase